MLGAWTRTKQGLPCPVCGGGSDGKQGYCLLHMDGKKVICPRVKSITKIKCGYIHKVYDNGLLGTKKAIHRRSNRRINWNNLNRLWMRKADATIWDLVNQVNLSIDTLNKFNVGWDGEAYTIPARNGFREVTGMQRRFPDGKKVWVPRSDGRGLFIPEMKSIEGNIFITEGWTDAGVFVEHGFRSLGRANCDSGLEHIKDFLADNPRVSRVTLVGDNDPNNVHGNVGQKGVMALARGLYGSQVEIGVLDIPEKYKDPRQWNTQGTVTKESIICRSRLI